jgi:cold shock CspA family protein
VVRTRVRSTPRVLRPPPVNPAAAKVPRRGPEQAAPATPASAAAPSAPPPVPPPADDGWRLGVVEKFDQARWEGTIRTAGSGAKVFPIAPGALRRAGLTNLFGGQRVEFRVVAGQADHLQLVVASGRAATPPTLCGRDFAR